LQIITTIKNFKIFLVNHSYAFFFLNVLIVSLASTEFEKGSGVNECANTDNMTDVHCKFKRLGARLMYGVRTLGVPVYGLRLSVGVWHLSLFLGHLVAC